ncbi:hypothetical protein DFH09DRAFT_1337063 [Mycena vulgaris]|nr:hypothetical protein DFH09DRAFT_1337063 [Mycena vulgaris]
MDRSGAQRRGCTGACCCPPQLTPAQRRLRLRRDTTRAIVPVHPVYTQAIDELAVSGSLRAHGPRARGPPFPPGLGLVYGLLEIRETTAHAVMERPHSVLYRPSPPPSAAMDSALRSRGHARSTLGFGPGYAAIGSSFPGADAEPTPSRDGRCELTDVDEEQDCASHSTTTPHSTSHPDFDLPRHTTTSEHHPPPAPAGPAAVPAAPHASTPRTPSLMEKPPLTMRQPPGRPVLCARPESAALVAGQGDLLPLVGGPRDARVDSYTNTTWATVSLIPLAQMNKMEREFLAGCGYPLFVSRRVYETWGHLMWELVGARRIGAFRHRTTSATRTRTSCCGPPPVGDAAPARPSHGAAASATLGAPRRTVLGGSRLWPVVCMLTLR